MDGRGRCRDNAWIERFHGVRLKQSMSYLNPHDTADALRFGI